MRREQKIRIFYENGRWCFAYGDDPPMGLWGSIHPMVRQMKQFYDWRTRIEKHR
jgi:hypothetical protein